MKKSKQKALRKKLPRVRVVLKLPIHKETRGSWVSKAMNLQSIPKKPA